MSFSHEYNLPVFIGTGAVATTGDTSQLVAGQIGLFDHKTYQAVSGHVKANQDLLVAAGSWHSKDKLNKFWGGLTESDKSINFLGKDILTFERSKPRRAESEQWVIGWDGISDCNTLSFECGKTYTYKVRVWGEDVYGTFLRPLDRFVSITTDCCTIDDCDDSCTGAEVGSKRWAQKLAEAINNDPELQYFVRAEAIHSDAITNTATHRLYCLTVCDTGDMQALAAVQQQYPTLKIERIERSGSSSTYQFCNAIAAGAPDAFTPVLEVALAVCGECPSGYTLVDAKDVYVVARPLAGTETLVTDGNKQTYANTVGSAYSATSAKFLGQNGATALIQLEFTTGTVVAAKSADTIEQVATKDAVCAPGAASTVAWVACGDRYKTTRTLCLALEKECGTDDRLADLEAFYANDPSIVPDSLEIKTAGTCGDLYQIEQYNNDCLVDGCLTEAIPAFDPIQSFEGFAWDEACPCDPIANDTSVLSGVRVEAAYEDTKFGGCTFSPTDYYSIRPLKLEITEFDDSGIPCPAPVPSRKLRNSSMATQSGEYVIREYIKAARYKAFGSFYHDPRMREVLDAQIHEVVDRNKFYNLYFLKVKQNRGNMNHQADFSPEIYEFMFAFPEGVDTSAFEGMISSVSSQFGINLQDR